MAQPFEQVYEPYSNQTVDPNGQVVPIRVAESQQLRQVINTYRESQPQQLGTPFVPKVNSVVDAMALTPGLALGSFINTITSSVGLTHEDSWDKLLRNNLPAAYDFYTRNRGAVDLIGQGGGALIPGTLGTKAVQGAGAFKFLKAIPYAEKFLVSTQKIAQLDREMNIAAETLAMKGVGSGFDAFPEAASAYSKLAKERRMLGYTKALKETVASELAVAATMHTSDVVFPKEFEWYDYLPFVGGQLLLSGGIERAVASKAINEAARRSAFLHTAALDPSLFLTNNLDKFTTRAGAEDVAITLLQSNTSELRQMAQEGGLAQTDSIYAKNINTREQQNDAAIFGHSRPTRFGQPSASQQRGYVDKIASRAVPEVAPSFQITVPQKDNIRLGMKTDPTTMLGVKELTDFTPDPQLAISLEERRTAYVEKLEKEASIATNRANSGKVSGDMKNFLLNQAAVASQTAKLYKNKEINPFVLRSGAWTPLGDNVVLFTDFPENKAIVKADPEFELKGLTVKDHVDPTTKKKFTARVDYQFNTSESLDGFINKSIYEQSTWFALHDDVIQNLARVRKENKDFTIPVNKASHWVRLEAINEALQRGAIDEQALVFQKGFNKEAMQHQILNDKYKDFLTLMNRNEKLTGAPESLRKAAFQSDAAIRYMLNLPKESFGQVSSLEELFHAFRMQGNQDLMQFPFQEIVDQALKSKHFPTGYEFMARDKAALAQEGYASLLQGSSMSPARSGNGQYLKPIVGWRMNMEPQKFTRFALDQTMAERRADVVGYLQRDYYDPGSGKLVPAPQSMVARLSNKILGTDLYRRASAVDLVNQNSLRGSGTFTYGRFAARDDAVLQATHDIETIMEKDVSNEIDNLFSTTSPTHGKTHSQTFQALVSSANEPSLIYWQEFARARQQGWYINKGVEPDGSLFKFTLDHTSEFNQKRFRQLYGRDLQKGDFLPAITNDKSYKPLQIDKLALDAAQSMDEIGAALLPEQNRVLAGMGRSAIRAKNWWMPPRVFTDKHVSYLVSKEEGGTIKRIITGNTEQELLAKESSDEVQQYLKANNATIYSQTQMVNELGQPAFHQARQRAFFEMLDAGDPIVKGTKASRGSSVDPFATSGRELLDESRRSIIKQMNNLGRDTVGLMFEPQITYAARMAHIDSLTGNQKNVWQYYVDQLLGNRALKTDATLGPIYQHIESGMDKALEYYWDRTNGKGVVGGLVAKVRQATGMEDKRFNRLKQTLGDWLPFDNTQEFLQSRFNIKPPTKSKELLAGMNHITSTVTLRLMDIAHPLLNFSGVIATMPVVIQAMRQQAGETIENWAQRAGAYTSFIPGARGATPFLNAPRLMSSAAWHGFTATGRKDWEYAARQGYLRQEVAEINRSLTSPLRTESDIAKFVRKGVDWASYLSDKSEELSRGWAHMAGVLLARQHGIQGDLATHVFANRFANEIIGDYRAVNKPAVFQGTVGMPLGLFQTYTWNYYQRIFGYIENKQAKAAAMQFAMQASVFGGTTLPGFQIFSNMWNSGLRGESNPVDEIQSRFGPNMADLLLYGTVSNIPKIWSDDGVALYSRGDMTPRIPAFLSPDQAPIYSFATNVFQLLGKSFDMFREGGVYSNQQLMELIGTYTQNRPLSRIMEIAAGEAIDRRGNVINNDVRSFESVQARLIGLRPLNEAKMIEVLRRQSQIEASQTDMRTRLRDGIKSAVRGNDVNVKVLRQAIEDYAISGGNPQYFPQFLKAAYINATIPKAQIKLKDLLNNDMRILDAIRLMNAGVRFDSELDISPQNQQE